MNRLINTALLLVLTALIFGCQPAEQYVEVNLRTLNTAQRHAIHAEMENIKKAVLLFETEKLRKPSSLDELIQEGYLPKPPKDPFGNGFTYDPVTNEVKSITLEAINKQREEQEKREQNRE